MFLIKKIKKLSGGREFVKEETVEKNDITIGRSTDSDIYLPDLRVALSHARIATRGKNGFVISALGDKPVQLGNRFGRGFSFGKGEKAVLRLGSFEVIVTREANGPITVAIEQLAQDALIKPDRDEKRIFSLSKTIWGKRSTAWLGLVSLLAVFLILPIVWFATGNQSHILAGHKPDEAWLSGPVSVAHSSIAEDCQSCHKQAFQSVTDAVCLDCHTELPDHADKGDMRVATPDAGVIGSQLNQLSNLFGRPPERCSSCHSEHNGSEGVILTAQSLCSDCHTGMDERLPDTNILNTADFGNDHPEFRVTLVEVQPDNAEPLWQRVSLDKNPVEKSGLKFPHDLHLDKTGGVANMTADMPEEYGGRDSLECADCHTLDAGGAMFAIPRMEKNCAACHSLAFDQIGEELRTLRHGKPKEVIASMRDFYTAQALFEITDQSEISDRRRPGAAARLAEDKRRREAIARAEQRTNIAVASIFSEGGACFDCHNIIEPMTGNVEDYDIQKVVLSNRFMPKALFVHDEHDTGELECASCHKAEDSDKATDVLMPKIAECQDCHGGEDAKHKIPSTCIMCHGFHEGDHPDIVPALREAARVWPRRREISGGQ